MSELVLYSLIESPTHPDFSRVYQQRSISEQRFTSTRKAISALKKARPDYVVAEFFYGYANNYAGVNISNLDVFLYSLQKYAPAAKVIVLVTRQELAYVEKLRALFPLHAVLQQPARAADMENVLDSQ